MGEKSNGGPTDSAGGQSGGNSLPPDGWTPNTDGKYVDPNSSTTFDPKTGVYSWPDTDGHMQQSMTEPTNAQKTRPCSTCGEPRPISAETCPHCGLK